MNKFRALSRKIAIISAHINKGQGKLGVELGPKLIKQEKLLHNLENLKYQTLDYAEIWDTKVDKEVNFFKNKNFASLAKSNQKVSQAVSSAIKDGCIPLTLGGDHSLAIGTLNGVGAALENRGVIWIDAHGDINLPEFSSTGNVHGQPVAFALNELSSSIPKLKELEWLTPNLPARNMVYIALRDLDEAEGYLINKYNILAYSMADIQRLGIEEVMKGVINHLTVHGKLLPLHVSVDIDSLDPWFAPCTGTPVLGGLTLPQLLAIGNTIHQTGMLRALDLVEVNPSLATNEAECKRTVFSAVTTILSFFGYDQMETLHR